MQLRLPHKSARSSPSLFQDRPLAPNLHVARPQMSNESDSVVSIQASCGQESGYSRFGPHHLLARSPPRGGSFAGEGCALFHLSQTQKHLRRRETISIFCEDARRRTRRSQEFQHEDNLGRRRARRRQPAWTEQTAAIAQRSGAPRGSVVSHHAHSIPLRPARGRLKRWPKRAPWRRTQQQEIKLAVDIDHPPPRPRAPLHQITLTLQPSRLWTRRLLISFRHVCPR